MIKILYSLLLCNIVIFYFFSITEFLKKLFKYKFIKINSIILGYSVFIICSYNLYFILNLSPLIIDFIVLIIFFFLLVNINEYKNKFFFTKKNLFINLIILLFLLPALVYGEQFFIFRGNYWDSSNYLSSAILFSNFQYSEVINKSFPSIFLEFQSIEYIIKARPMVNFLLSIFLNNYFSIFFSFYLFKIIITILIFISLLTFVEDNFDLKNISALLISFAFVISFWNIYIFEIDALSHYSSIPILILTIQYLFKVFNNLYNKENYLILVVLTSSLFIIYPEILIIVFSILLILLIDNIRSFNKKIIKLFLLSFLVFIFFTATSYETNYKHLIDSQLNQAVRANDWWGYFGSFIIGKDSLVLDTQFVSNLKLMISSNDSSKNIIKFIHTEHFNNNFKFIYLNIIPSLSGLYFLTIDKLVKNYLFIFQIFFLIFLIIYILKICYINIVYLLSNKFSKKKFLYFLSINIFLLLFFFNHSSFWSIIKLYTYLFPLLFLFFAINLQKKKVNYLYVFLISTFCLYKFSDFNNGIGRHDSFPSIINPMIKKEIIWTDKSYKNLQYCSNSSIIKNNYIIKAYLNLKIIDLGINKVKNQNCNVYLDNKKFKVIHE